MAVRCRVCNEIPGHGGRPHRKGWWKLAGSGAKQHHRQRLPKLPTPHSSPKTLVSREILNLLPGRRTVLALIGGFAANTPPRGKHSPSRGDKMHPLYIPKVILVKDLTISARITI